MQSLRSVLKPNFALRGGWAQNYLQRPGEGVQKKVTLIPGVGIGPEITSKFRINLLGSV